MSQPPDIDAILESIRSRVIGEIAATPPIASLAPVPEPRAARLLPTPIIDGGGVPVEALFAAVLEPLLRQWIDANLPEICERIAQAEIKRLTGQA